MAVGKPTVLLTAVSPPFQPMMRRVLRTVLRRGPLLILKMCCMAMRSDYCYSILRQGQSFLVRFQREERVGSSLSSPSSLKHETHSLIFLAFLNFYYQETPASLSLEKTVTASNGAIKGSFPQTSFQHDFGKSTFSFESFEAMNYLQERGQTLSSLQMPSALKALMTVQNPGQRRVPLRMQCASCRPQSYLYFRLSLLLQPSSVRAQFIQIWSVRYSKSQWAVSTTWSQRQNTAGLFAARRAPIGDHVNLYPIGLSMNSGDGRAPQKLWNYSILKPSSLNLSISIIALKWSMPGSKPSYIKKVRPAYLASAFSCYSSLFVQLAVTRCFLCLRHCLAT